MSPFKIRNDKNSHLRNYQKPTVLPLEQKSEINGKLLTCIRCIMTYH